MTAYTPDSWRLLNDALARSREDAQRRCEQQQVEHLDRLLGPALEAMVAEDELEQEHFRKRRERDRKSQR